MDQFGQYAALHCVCNCFICNILHTYILVHDHGLDMRYTGMLNRLHVEAQCCGINGWDDFINTPWGIDPANLRLAVPATCCIDQSPSTLKYCQEDGNQEYYHRAGCHERIKDSIKQIECDMKASDLNMSILYFDQNIFDRFCTCTSLLRPLEARS